MANYILQYRGSGVPDTQQVKETLHACGINIVDGSLLPHTVLLEMTENDVSVVKGHFEADWSLTPEKKYSVPDSRRKIKGKDE